jgi:tRNA A37 N6-isopentenylltransferase MiaA
MGYLSSVKPELQPTPVEPEKLKPVLHDKIERMDGLHLSVLNRVLLQLEAEELAGRLNESFDKDFEQGLLRRVPELVKQFRDECRYA